VPNAISDSNKNSRNYNKNSMISSGSKFKMTTTSTSPVANNSSNQLADGVSETPFITHFSTSNFTNITTQVGSIVELPCTVHHLSEGTMVSFKRILQ
jgi:hypothetical protein